MLCTSAVQFSDILYLIHGEHLQKPIQLPFKITVSITNDSDKKLVKNAARFADHHWDMWMVSLNTTRTISPEHPKKTHDNRTQYNLLISFLDMLKRLKKFSCYLEDKITCSYSTLSMTGK